MIIDYGNILDYNFNNCKYIITDSKDYNTLVWLDDSKKPTQDELDILNNKTINLINKNKCKNNAKILISQSDWSVLPDVKILNKSEFELYRSKLRAFILEPVEDPIFPEEPSPIWSN